MRHWKGCSLLKLAWCVVGSGCGNGFFDFHYFCCYFFALNFCMWGRLSNINWLKAPGMRALRWKQAQ
jgi:hypothetical protein